MIHLSHPYLDKKDFATKIRRAMDNVLFRAMDAEEIGEVIYDDLFQMCVLMVQQNVEQIKQDIENGDTYWKINNLEYKLRQEFESEIKTLNNKIQSLEWELHQAKRKY